MSGSKYQPVPLATLPSTLDSAEYDMSQEIRKVQVEHEVPNLNGSIFFNTMTPNAEHASKILSWLTGPKQDQQMSS